MKTIVTICTILAFAFGAWFYLDDRFAKCEDVKKVEKRLDLKILSDQLMHIQQRIWTIKDRAGEKPKDPTVKEELNRLEIDKQLMEKKLDAAEKK